MIKTEDFENSANWLKDPGTDPNKECGRNSRRNKLSLDSSQGATRNATSTSSANLLAFREFNLALLPLRPRDAAPLSSTAYPGVHSGLSSISMG